jgi:hypothetical protein
MATSPPTRRPLSSALTTDRETLVAIDSEQALVVHQEALPSKQDVKAPVAEAPALMRQGTQPLPQSCVVWSARMLPHRHPHAADNARHSRRTQNVGERQPLAWQWASPSFSQQILQRGIVEHRIGQKLLELGMLAFQYLIPACPIGPL